MAVLFLLVFCSLTTDLLAKTTFNLPQNVNFTIGSKHVIGKRITHSLGFYDQCYVDIRVFNSTTYKHGLENATVTLLSGPINDPPATTDFSQSITDAYGKVCLSVRCHQQTWLFVDKNHGRLKAANDTVQKQNIPQGFYVTSLSAGEVLQLYSSYFGGTDGRTGPVYVSFQEAMCKTAGVNNHYFVFSYIAAPDRLVSTPVPTAGLDLNDPRYVYSWRYAFPGDERSCFLKIKVQTSTTQAVVRAFSKLMDKDGTVLGLFETGPQYDVRLSGTVEKAACVKFRCPTRDFKNGTYYNTFIEGHLDVPNVQNGCCAKNSGTIFAINETSFRSIAPLERNDNYGIDDGIYISGDANVARIRCFTGQMVVLDEYPMNTSTGYAFEYDCTLAPDCKTILT